MKKPEISSGRIAQNKPVNTKKITREEFTRQIQKMRDRDNELVTGVFKNMEMPGSKISVRFGYKIYPGQEIEFYELVDGERCRLPRGVARHLNNNCFYKEYQHLSGEYGMAGMRTAESPDGKLSTQTMQMSRKVHRYAFHSLEFMDDDMDMTPSNLVEVTAAP